jgi:hypothetical protein
MSRNGDLQYRLAINGLVFLKPADADDSLYSEEICCITLKARLMDFMALSHSFKVQCIQYFLNIMYGEIGIIFLVL